MKKITIFVSALALTGSMFGQSQRTILAEEFTQASCPPCAAQNPAFNTLLQANPTKLAAIKYQTVWPGVDPMNAENQVDVADRVTYYGINGVPDAPMDGHDLPGNTTLGSYYTGAPHNWTQARIDSAYAVPSPYTLTISHTFSSDYSTITISGLITCTQATTGTLKLRLGIIEKVITFATAPGTNGETVFYNVMKKLVPNSTGTTVTAMAVGATQPYTFTVPVPNWIYDLNQVNVIGWIQNDGTKDVLQAGNDSPLTLPVSTLDAGVSTITGLNAIQCVTSVTPSVTVKNYSATTMTSCTINYAYDGGAVTTMPWTGSLATGATQTVALPTMTVAVGSHTLTAYTTHPNAGNDYYLINDSQTKTFNIIGSSALAPVSEGFTSATFPPTNWVIDNPDGSYTWEHVTTFGGYSTTSQCMAMNFYSSPAGSVDDIYIKALDLTTTMTHGVLTFDVAHAQYASESDVLEVQVSTDCGTTWTTPYNKGGAVLATAPVTTSSFVPTVLQWRTDGVDMTPYLHQTNVLVRFRAVSAYGNNLFVDNINLFTSNSALGIDNVVENGVALNVFPNPFSDNTTVAINLTQTSPVTVTMYNVLGESVYTNSLGQMSAGKHSLNLDSQKLSAGVYYITVTVADGTITKKVVINK
jgi:hypothetical protein